MSIIADLSDEALTILKEAGHEAKAFVLTEVSHAIVWLRGAAGNEPLITKTLNLVSDLENRSMSGAEKMSKVVAAISDLVVTFLTEGGFGHLADFAATIARGLAQMVFADFKAAIAKA